uniref:Uncharacterized protein n=1 Tax=Fundulus heteroclitus TaxID=8078 RepID=A0A3Q2QZ41_FUNHE
MTTPHPSLKNLSGEAAAAQTEAVDAPALLLFLFDQPHSINFPVTETREDVEEAKKPNRDILESNIESRFIKFTPSSPRGKLEDSNTCDRAFILNKAWCM